MTNRKQIGQLNVAIELADFINHELLPKIDRDEGQFWAGFEAIIREFSPRNSSLLAEREDLQIKIDNWHRERCDQKHDAAVDHHAVLLARRPDVAGADTRRLVSALVYARALLGRAVAVRVNLAHVALVAHVGFAVAARQQQARQGPVVLAARFDESPIRSTVPR